MPLFMNTDEIGWTMVEPGFERVIAVGKSMSVTYCHVAAGSASPPEQHPEEQINFIVEGRMEWVLGEAQNIKYLCGPGSILLIEPNMIHSNSVVGDEEVKLFIAFNPPRYADLADAVRIED